MSIRGTTFIVAIELPFAATSIPMVVSFPPDTALWRRLEINAVIHLDTSEGRMVPKSREVRVYQALSGPCGDYFRVARHTTRIRTTPSSVVSVIAWLQQSD